MNETKKNKSKETRNEDILPEKYERPSINSEELMAFAASCNGTATGGRKSSVGAPAPFCNARRLNS